MIIAAINDMCELKSGQEQFDVVCCAFSVEHERVKCTVGVSSGQLVSWSAGTLFIYDFVITSSQSPANINWLSWQSQQKAELENKK